MQNFLLGVLITVLIVLGVTRFISSRNAHKIELESSGLILDQINNVGKLIVTEGHFSEVITYKDDKKLYMDLWTVQKKAIVVVNATVTVGYDLSKIKHTIDTDSKTLTITHIPKVEVSISPDIKYHDLEADFLNQFTPEDHNLIKKKIMKQLHKKIESSSLKANAENRLLSELQKIYILTNSLGWKLVYNGNPIQTIDELIP